MRSLARRLVTGRGHWWLPAGLYLAALLAVYLAGVVLGTVEHGEPTLASAVYEPLLFPGMLMYAPGAIAALIALRGYPPVASVVLGVSAGFGFATLGNLSTLLGTSGNGDSSLWALSLAFAGIGLAVAVAGHVVGSIGSIARERLA